MLKLLRHTVCSTGTHLQQLTRKDTVQMWVIAVSIVTAFSISTAAAAVAVKLVPI
jgi:hypothetical protein